MSLDPVLLTAEICMTGGVGMACVACILNTPRTYRIAAAIALASALVVQGIGHGPIGVLAVLAGTFLAVPILLFAIARIGVALALRQVRQIYPGTPFRTSDSGMSLGEAYRLVFGLR